ncbi:MAG: hypothetical protein WDN48_00125 [Pseudolabrys sp.]
MFAAGHDKSTTSYPLWTLDKETVTQLCAQAAPPGGVWYCGANRQARVGIDVSRQSGARLAAQYHALPAQDRLFDAVRGFQSHHQVHAPEFIAHRDFTPIKPADDDALAE